MGIALIYLGAANLLKDTPEPTSVAQIMIAAAAGIFLLAGLWTPLAGVLAALHQVWITLSIDARLFGRRRFYSDRSRGSSPFP